MNELGPFHEAVKVVIFNPDNHAQVRNVSTGAWVNLSSAPAFAACIAVPLQIGATGIYVTDLPAGLTTSRAYPLMVYAIAATAFTDQASEAEYVPPVAEANLVQVNGAPITPVSDTGDEISVQLNEIVGTTCGTGSGISGGT